MRRPVMLSVLLVVVAVGALPAQDDWWEDTHGPSGGDIYAMAFPSSDAILAGMMDSVYRSTDEGLNWTMQGTPGMGVLSFLTHSSGTVFAGTYLDGLFRSDDSGMTWAPSGIFNGRVFCVAENQQGHVFVGMKDFRLLRSEDQGHTWTLLAEDMPFYNVLSLLVNHQNYLFAGTYHGTGIFRSTDNGDTWTPVNEGFVGNYVYSLVEDSGGRLYAAAGAGVYRSLDNGDHWAPWNDGIGDNVGVAAMTKGPADLMYALSNNKVFRRLPEGASWEQIGDFSHSETGLAGIAVRPNGDVFVGMGGGGILVYSPTKAAWRQVASGVVYALLFDEQQNLYAGTGAGVYKRLAGSGTWVHCADHPVFAAPVRALAWGEDGALYAGTEGQGVAFSADGGATWETANAGLTHLGVRALCRVQGGLLAGTDGGGLFRLPTGAGAWQTGALPAGNVWCFARATDGKVFAGTYGDSTFVSTDEGQTWRSQRVGYSYDKYIYALTAGNRGEVYCGTLGAFFKLPTNATNWVQIHNNWTLSAAVTPDDDVIAGKWTQNVMMTRNHGASWFEINYGLINKVINAFCFDPQGYLYAGTGGGGVARSIRPILPKGTGDLNADGRVDGADFTVFCLQQTGMVEPGAPPFTGRFQDGDLNGDYALNATDLALLAHRLVGLSDPYRGY